MEEKNLNIEIKRRMKTLKTDILYKTVHEAMDIEEEDKRLEVEGNTFITTGTGEDATEEQKEHGIKKLKF